MSDKSDAAVVDFIQKHFQEGNVNPESREVFQKSFVEGWNESQKLQAEGKPYYRASFPEIRRLELLYKHRDRFPESRDVISELYQLLQDYLEEFPEIRQDYDKWIESRRAQKGKADNAEKENE